jgi:hypothetical protein
MGKQELIQILEADDRDKHMYEQSLRSAIGRKPETVMRRYASPPKTKFQLTPEQEKLRKAVFNHEEVNDAVIDYSIHKRPVTSSGEINVNWQGDVEFRPLTMKELNTVISPTITISSSDGTVKYRFENENGLTVRDILEAVYQVEYEAAEGRDEESPDLPDEYLVFGNHVIYGGLYFDANTQSYVPSIE